MSIFKGWRTIALNIGLALPILWDVLVQIVAIPELQQLVPPQHQDKYLLLVTVVNIALRCITTTPVGRAK